MSMLFKVRYKPNPRYKGSFGIVKEPGIQGTFELLEKAEAAAESCKRYFNTQKFVEDVAHPDGSVTQERQAVQHDNVIVWIESYEDGVLQVEEKELASA
jgi:hypothetical protein